MPADSARGGSDGGGTKGAMAHRLLGSPELYLLGLNFRQSQGFLVPMTERSYRDSAFLDQRLVRGGGEDTALDIATLARVSQALPHRPIHYIFHVGHCGSTLLSRMLGEMQGFFSLREPLLLMALARAARDLGTAETGMSRADWTALRDLLLAYLSRTWRASQTALIKASSHANNVAPELMAWSPHSRAVFLYIGLEDYLATMLRPKPREETRDFYPLRRADFARAVGAAPDCMGELGEAEKTALVWLMNRYEYRRLVVNPALNGRLLPLRFDDLLAAPRETVHRVAAFLGEPPVRAELDAAVAPGLLGSYAKSPGIPFDSGRRQESLFESRRLYGDEIARALDWARCATERFPVLGTADDPLFT